MKYLTRFLFFVLLGLVGLLVYAWPARSVAASAPTPAPPPGFQPVDAAPGVTLYKKEYPNGSPDYVQVIDLSQGAKVELLYGQVSEPRPTKGSFGGPDPSMTSLDIRTYWEQTSARQKQAFCVFNGAFFYMPDYPTRLAFPLKVDGQIVTEGWGIDTHPGEHQMLELWDDRANIQEMTQASLYASSAPNILGGLTEEANKRIKYAVGRTFVGVADRDGDGQNETVLVLTTRTALQSGAASVLREFGAGPVMMLDGGGSTQLLCKSGWYIRSDRPVPQALAVIAAEPPPIALELTRQTEWPTLLVGEKLPFEVELRNTGVVTWTEAAASFYLKNSPFSLPYSLPISGTVPPGGRAVLQDTLPSFNQAGVYPLDIEWGLRYQDKNYPGPTIHLNVVVLPPSLADQRPVLQAELQRWKSEATRNAPNGLAADATEQIEARLAEWMQSLKAPTLAVIEPSRRPTQANHSEARIRLSDVIWVPVLMLPIVIFLGFALARRNS